MSTKTFTKIVPFFLIVLLLAACGAKAVTLADIPAYPDATLLNPGDDPIADTLVQNMAQDAQIRTSVGVGGSMEQQAYRLPAGTSWDAVSQFYTDELTGAGWKAGVGGPGGDIAGDILNQANAGNDLFQTTIFSKGKQTLTIIRSADPVNPESLYLIFSLTTN
jgi:hypothetical protein